MEPRETPLMRHIKLNAKRLKKTAPGMTHTEALEMAAKKAGYQNWKAVRDQQLGGERDNHSTSDHGE